MKSEEQFIRKNIASSIGSGESSRVYLEVDKKTGESELVISKTYQERYPVTDYDKVVDLHAKLNAGGGRRAYSLKELTE